MSRSQAQYLLRFDDLCPTMALERWRRFLPIVEELGIRPILAVVPENCDSSLQICPPDSEFWPRMRTMQAAGATIGLHGYRHLCQSTGKSLVPFHRTSEFPGVPYEIQRQWIQAGLAILRSHGLNPQIWVAPRHGLDDATLRVLQSEGISAISDGLARIPFSQGSLTWIPQQLWAPVEKRSGVWTICIHSNTASDQLADKLCAFVSNYREQFTCVDKVLREFVVKELGSAELLYGAYSLARFRLSKFRRALFH